MMSVFIGAIIAGLVGTSSGHLPPVPWPSSPAASPTVHKAKKPHVLPKKKHTP
jgi:hypothetical protein